MNKVKKIISALLIICMCAVMAFVNKTDILEQQEYQLVQQVVR